MPPDGRRGSRTPKARRPTRFRDGIPRRWQSFPASGPGRRRTCNPPIKRRQLCRVELRSQRCDRQGSNLRRLAFQASALPPSYGSEWRTGSRLSVRRLRDAARLESNQQPLVCKTGALPVELPARDELRDKGSNLDLHVQSVVSCRLDDPGSASALHPPPATAGCRCSGGKGPAVTSVSSSVTLPLGKRCCLCHSPTLRPWIVGTAFAQLRFRRPTVEGFWSPALSSFRKTAS